MPNLQEQLKQLQQNQINAWAIKDPQTEQLKLLQQQQIAQEQQMFQAQQANIGRASQFTPMDNLAPLIGLTDQWTGSNFGKTYQAPESAKDRVNKVQALESGLASAQNILTDNQLNQLKSALSEKKADKQNQQQYLMHLDNMQNQKDIASLKLNKDVKDKPLVPAQVAELANLKDQQKNLDNNYKDWQKLASGTGSSALSIIPNTDPNIYEAKRLQAGTDFGKTMLGNARSHDMLMTHVQMLPGSTDSAEKALAKTTLAKELAKEKYNQKLAAFKEAGYDIRDLKPLGDNAPENTSDSGGKNPAPWERNW